LSHFVDLEQRPPISKIQSFYSKKNKKSIFKQKRIIRTKENLSGSSAQFILPNQEPI
jgi:hypothetical protein